MVIGVLAVMAVGIARTSPVQAEPAQAQFCWAFGRYDDTVYYAAIEGREDRSASFAELLEISGIDHFGALCPMQGISQHRLTKTRMLGAWKAAEFEVVDTTFLSDLDY
ncbi:hypothetical protein X566_10730 [Afipia sp. P52-10]|uniref:hypothetical protein n=1 Tax=Afipia sp. P52-10 TaxID=1429916 RepID=UPI0003DF43C3|nr:hypothetical protein [Afipia sp. P52-10]ETR79062.1 hypothetical protein X566_10730 [Afipia sp. P52-10]